MDIYGDLASGNCLKVKYTADLLEIPYRWVAVDVAGGAARSAEFSALNPMAQVPVIVLDDGRTLAQSNAIIEFFAEGSALLPADAFARARVHQWLYWEQYSHEPYVAVCRYQMVYLGQPREARETWRVERGEQALDLMERVLSQRTWLATDELTIADISLLAYTRLAGEGGFELSSRPHVRRWIRSCEAALALDAGA